MRPASLFPSEKTLGINADLYNSAQMKAAAL